MKAAEPIMSSLRRPIPVAQRAHVTGTGERGTRTCP